VQVFAIRSTAVNAFATERGTVFVTLGLLAQLENEAQLAIVISHELSHVQEGHALHLFLKGKNVERNSSRKSVMDETTFDLSMLEKNSYSKELELEADKKGLERLLKTDYSTSTLNTLLDVLKYASLPFDEVKFEKSFFESGLYHFPEGYWLPQVKPVVGEEENAADQTSTHPNIAARRKAMESILAAAHPKEGKNFLVSEERFINARQIARFEQPNLYLHRGNLPNAVYDAYLLLQKDPENAYLQKCVAKALYLSAKTRNDPDYTVPKTAQKTEGESQQLHHLMDTLSSRELTVLALRYAWPLQTKFKDDAEIKTIVQDLFTELASQVDSLGVFTTSLPPQPVATAETEPQKQESAEPKPKSKYQKIKKSTKKAQIANNYWQVAFADYLKDDAFKTAFAEGQKKYRERKEREDEYREGGGSSQRMKEARKEELRGQRMGIPKVVIVNPLYLKLDARKDNAMQYVETEYGEENMRNILESVAAKTDLKVKILDVENLKAGQTDVFNDIRMLNEWFSEQASYDDLSLTPGVNQDKINAIAEKYGTDYFLWTGVISLHEKKKNQALAIAAGIIYFPLLPLAIYYAAKPKYDMLYFAVLFDVRTGRRKTIKFDYFSKKDTDSMLKAHTYDTLLQINAR
jgi:hypothetical protein